MPGVVIALGGNALGKTVEAQKKAAAVAAKTIADIAAMGIPLLVTHGNGPQVGMISSAMRCGSAYGSIPEEIPLAECVAMSQGYIGFHLQLAIEHELRGRGMDQRVCTLVTQMLVNPDDPAFAHPTKPVGDFYSQSEAQRLSEETGECFREDAGRGWRRVVASPEPQDIVERDVVRQLVEMGIITICGGGGGIPVLRREHGFEAVSAVIDKDYGAALLAKVIQAETLMILTGVSNVYLNYNTPEQKRLDLLKSGEAKALCERGCFAQGSMLPKVQAALRFAESGGKAVITSLESAAQALKGNGGTWIVPDSA